MNFIKYICFAITLFMMQAHSGRSIEHEFANDYFKYVSTLNQRLDSVHFITKFILKDSDKAFFTNTLKQINGHIDGSNEDKLLIEDLKQSDFNIKWKSKKLDHQLTEEGLGNFPVDEDGFRRKSYFTISKPIFLTGM